MTLPKSQEPRVEGREPDGKARQTPALDSQPSTLDSSTGPPSSQPRGTETRLGQALADQLRLYRDAPLAGVVVISDGAQNAGIEPSAAIEAAQQAKVPLYTIGVGSTAAQRNVALRDLVVPTRAFPGDTLNITGYLQANGYAGRSVDVELTRRRAEEPAGGGTPIASERVALGADGEIVPVSFDIEPGEAGHVRLSSFASTRRPTTATRATTSARRKSKSSTARRACCCSPAARCATTNSCATSCTATRTMIVDVLLQTAQPGISQDANKILDQFPSTAEELYQYDCIVAFDPDWTKLDADAGRAARKMGLRRGGRPDRRRRADSHRRSGFAAPSTPSSATCIRSMFQQRLTLLDDGQYGGDTPGRSPSSGPAARRSSSGSAKPPKKAKPPGTTFPACTATTP